MKGELKGDSEHHVLQGIISHGLQRIDLRDEIFCQLMRQTSDNPHDEQCLRVWHLMYLCLVSFHPSRILKKVRGGGGTEGGGSEGGKKGVE